jgi:hypothetical protein
MSVVGLQCWGLAGLFQAISFALFRISRTCHNEVRLALFELPALDRTTSVLGEWSSQSDALFMPASISIVTSRFSLVTSSHLCLVSKRCSLMAFTSAVMQHVQLAILGH